MKTLLTIAFAVALGIGSAHGQNSSTSSVPPASSMESSGTITDYTPDSSLVLDTGTGEPVHFVFGKHVTYVGSDGQPVEASGLRKNLRVRVHYVVKGADKVIDKVSLAE